MIPSGLDVAEIERLSKLNAFPRLADSILKDLDRDSLAELLAGYLYLKSKGMTNIDFLLFVTTWRFPKGLTLLFGLTAAIVPGLLADEEFRAVVLQVALHPRK